MRSTPGRLALALLIATAIVTAMVHAAPGDEKPVRAVAPNDINWAAVPGYPAGYARAMLEGEADKAVPFTYRVRLPAGFTFQPHTHAGDEHVTVLQGAWSFGIGETFEAARLKAFPAGSFVVIPAGTPHFIAVEAETVVQVHGVGPIGFRPAGHGEAR